jgi:hypothetical protein
MKYLLLCCANEKQWNAIPDSQREGIMRDYRELMENLHQSGRHLSTGKLEPVSTATTVRCRNGKPFVIDGPFAETKEQLGGYHVVECQDLDEAVAIAKRIPTLPYGGTIEVRPLEELW